MVSAVVTLAGVLGFALSMILGSDFGSYLSSMFIAWGFVPLICSFAAYSGDETKSVSTIAIAFSAVYTAFIMIVYFAQLTTVRLSELSQPIAQIIDYKAMGLFFNYDLLGYGFMALATFFIAWTIKAQTKADKWLKGLFLAHGIFAVSCVLIPILGVFAPGTASDISGGGTAGGQISSELIGVLVLEFWCAYFTPVCVLSYLHFARKKPVPIKKH